jgi:hypothetical protein
MDGMSIFTARPRGLDVEVSEQKNYSKISINFAKAVFGFIPQAFDQAINSVMSTRLLATSQL